MKKSIISFAACFLLIGSVFSQREFIGDEQLVDDEQIVDENKVVLNWEPTFKHALKKSKKEKKPILLYFTGSDWCKPCISLNKELFYTEKFKKLADKNFILYEVDEPRNKDLLTPDKLKKNHDLRIRYKSKNSPALVFVDHKGKMIGAKRGLILTEYYYYFMDDIIRKY